MDAYRKEAARIRLHSLACNLRLTSNSEPDRDAAELLAKYLNGVFVDETLPQLDELMRQALAARLRRLYALTGMVNYGRYPDKDVIEMAASSIGLLCGSIEHERAKLEEVFQCVYDAYNKPRDMVPDDNAYILFMRKKLGAAYTLLQYITGRLKK